MKLRSRSYALVAIACTIAACGRIGIDRRDEHGMTALMRAARNKDRVAAERLMRRGANVNAKVPTRNLRELIAFLSWMQQLPESDIGYTPLMYAARGGDSAIVRLLIEHGADVRSVARFGETAMDLAVYGSHLEAIRLLVGAGARPTAKHLATAVRLSTPATVSFLLQNGADPNAVPPPARSGRPWAAPIILAAMRGDTVIIQTLIAAGANVNTRDANGWTALRWARERGGARGRDTATVAVLQGAGASDRSGERASALFKAVQTKDVEAVRRALRDGANPNARDDRGVPALVYAGHLGIADIVDALVDAGAHVNANPMHDTTPLIAAIMGGSVSAVKRLIAAGALVDQPDHVRQTPLQVAASWKRAEIAELLLAASAKVDPAALPIAALRGDTMLVRLLLAKGIDPNGKDGHALSEATRGCSHTDNGAVIALLLQAGANANVGVGGAITPLQRAAGMCSSESVRLLLARGADPNGPDWNAFTPLGHAIISGKVDNLRVLIAAGANVNARDKDGKSMLQYAAGRPDIEAELRRAGAR